MPRAGRYIARDLLSCMVHKGWLEAGTYLINNCW